MSTQIEASADELVVQIVADHSRRTLIWSVFALLGLLAQGARVVKAVESSLHAQRETWLYHVALICLPLVGVLLLLWAALQFSRPFFGRKQSLRATHAELEVSSSDFDRTWQNRVFLKEDIRSVAFAAVSVAMYSAVKGLTFTVGREEIKILGGLKAADAQRVLGELKRLGFDVVIDPAMRMVIELEQARDRSFFR